MHKHKKFVYIHFPKTGGNTLKTYFNRCFDVNVGGFHEYYDKDPHLDKKIVTSIRNPYDWYVSYWNITKDGYGSVSNKLKKINQFGIVDDFDKFIRFFCGDRFRNYDSWPPMGEMSNGRKFSLGFYSTGFYNMFSGIENWSVEFGSEEDVYSSHYIDEFIFTNNLKSDLQNFLSGLDLECGIVEEETIHKNKNRDNNYQKYYNNETKSLVEKSDGYLINKFGFKFD